LNIETIVTAIVVPFAVLILSTFIGIYLYGKRENKRLMENISKIIADSFKKDIKTVNDNIKEIKEDFGKQIGHLQENDGKIFDTMEKIKEGCVHKDNCKNSMDNMTKFIEEFAAHIKYSIEQFNEIMKNK
jgi:hypothetical protein